MIGQKTGESGCQFPALAVSYKRGGQAFRTGVLRPRRRRLSAKAASVSAETRPREERKPKELEGPRRTKHEGKKEAEETLLHRIADSS